jgi:tRNA A37 threonylcarbamoyladenosine dehydratase
VAAAKLELARLAIVGTGGTDAYILDLVAKTPVREIHLFDGDEFFSHNAFRAPGAAGLDELRARPKKVTYFAERYVPMRRGVLAHPYDLDASNVADLHGMDFVFLSLDTGPAKRLIVEELERCDIGFIDVGMGVELVEGSLRGILRRTTSTPGHRAHFRDRALLGDAGIPGRTTPISRSQTSTR